MRSISASSATDPAVWYGPDFRGNDEWIFALDPRHVSELEAVVDSVPASGDALVDLQRSNCEMPTLSAELRHIQEDVVRGRGFALIRGLPVDR